MNYVHGYMRYALRGILSICLISGHEDLCLSENGEFVFWNNDNHSIVQYIQVFCRILSLLN